MSYQSISHPCEGVLQSSQEITDGELETALQTAAITFKQWRGKTPLERATVISGAAEILRTRVEEFALPVTFEMPHLFETARREVTLAADVIDYFAKNSQSLIHPDVDPTFAESDHFGIIFGAQPDLYPYFQLARLTAPNLMAGNVVIIKHAGSIPPCAVAFERLWLEAGAPAGAFTNLLVSHAQAARIQDDPRIKCASNGGVDVADRINRKTGPVFPADIETAPGLRKTALMRGGPLV